MCLPPASRPCLPGRGPGGATRCRAPSRVCGEGSAPRPGVPSEASARTLTGTGRHPSLQVGIRHGQAGQRRAVSEVRLPGSDAGTLGEPQQGEPLLPDGPPGCEAHHWRREELRALLSVLAVDEHRVTQWAARALHVRSRAQRPAAARRPASRAPFTATLLTPTVFAIATHRALSPTRWEPTCPFSASCTETACASPSAGPLPWGCRSAPPWAPPSASPRHARTPRPGCG